MNSAQYQPYNGSPPHAVGSETSLEASESVRPSAAYMRNVVLRMIKLNGETGATCDEVEAVTGFIHQTCSARFRELELKGLIKKTDGKRQTRRGRNAVVYVARARKCSAAEAAN